MQTRIRYSKQIDGTMLSKEFFYTNHNGAVRVRLNLEALKYDLISCEATKHIVDSGTTTDAAQLKKQAKEALKKQGVLFGLETRNTTARLKEIGIDYNVDKRDQ